MYPMEPCNDGIALIEYVVLNKALGDFEIDRLRPRGTVKSKMAEVRTLVINRPIVERKCYLKMSALGWQINCPHSTLLLCSSFGGHMWRKGASVNYLCTNYTLYMSFPNKPRVPHSIILLSGFIPTNTILIVRLVQANLHPSFLHLPCKIVVL